MKRTPKKTLYVAKRGRRGDGSLELKPESIRFNTRYGRLYPWSEKTTEILTNETRKENT